MRVAHGAMSYTHTRLVYTAIGSGSQYIDLTKGLALMNAKNCSQFRKDKPILVHGSVRLETASERIDAAKNTWVVRNACVKAAAAWRRTLRSAGIYSKKQLNTYARDMRLAMDEDHAVNFGYQGGSHADLIPNDVETSYKTGVYEAETGDEISVYASLDSTAATYGGKFQRAFTQTTFAVPQSGSTDVLDKKANLLGSVNGTYSNVVAEYIDSRINDAEVEDTDLDQSPSNDNDFVMMLAPGEEVADDVLDNVDDEGKWRPYTLHTSTDAAPVVLPDANVAGQDTYFEAPLGLLKWTPSGNGSTLVIDVTHMTEM
jgi:hypothetical protein